MYDTYQPGDQQETTVEVYTRPELLLEPQDAKLTTLEQLAADGAISELTLNAWPDKIPISPESKFRDTVDVFERFDAWASEHDISIQPPFEVQASTSELWGETRRILRTPILCIAIYTDAQLVGVFPSVEDGTYQSADSAIAALKTGNIDSILPAGVTIGEDRHYCPDCEGELMNVQGVRICQDCSWVESTLERDRVQPSKINIH